MEQSARRPPLSGATMFVRYAYPPNELGYCGSSDHRALLEYGAAGVVDPGLTRLVQAFQGAWPYLQLIAEATGIGDPLDARVVEAYWVGSKVLDTIDMNLLGNALQTRFHLMGGPNTTQLQDWVSARGVPHHSFHVFGVYPWVGLLAADRHGDSPLHVLDRCRIRWGTIVALEPSTALVDSQPLTWDGHQLALGDSRTEVVKRAADGYAFVGDLQVGDPVSMHWDWLCDRLSPRQVAALRHYTSRHLDIVNHRVERAGALASLV
ncbi:MAG: hypothetical protein QOJ62_3041 [Actinomycetota bacterium]|jgi:hypothetical protein|nr:hypothetical protein [Actinomycetota bacterium]